ncbi:MAG: AIR synthase family protein [Sulfolobales archaeon]
MRIGKLTPEELNRLILSRTGARDPKVIVGGSVGEDAAIIDIGGGLALVVHTDPITGSLDLLGFLGIMIPSNDIAVRGVKPSWASVNIFLPPQTTESEIDRITRQIHEAAERLSIAIVGGHTEYTDAVKRPVIVSTIFGIGSSDKVITTRGAKTGDLVIMTKTAGIEGTAILARDFRKILLEKGVSESVIRRASEYYNKISVLEEALTLASKGIPSSMHDPTEGGIIAGLAEIAYASGKSIEVYMERIPISQETRELSEAMGIDPLKMLSSGSLLACVPRDRVDEALSALREKGIDAEIIGEVVEKKEYLLSLISESKRTYIKNPYVEDPVIKLFNSMLG